VYQAVVAQMAKPTFIIKGGVSSASFIWEDDLGTIADTDDNRMGYKIGMGMDFPINEIVNFETGLYIARKGMKKKEDTMTHELTPVYLEIPLNLKFIKALNNMSLYGTVGAYLGYGVAGEFETSGKEADGGSFSYSCDIEWGSSEENDMKPLDFGGGLGVGLIFDKIEAGLYGSSSFINNAANTEGGHSIRNVEFGLMVGYRL